MVGAAQCKAPLPNWPRRNSAKSSRTALRGIYQCTPVGEFLTVNPAMARIFDVATPQELLGQSPQA